MKQHVKEILIGETLVEIKSRTDERYPSGWSVIAFTPELSIRSTKLHRPSGRTAFINAILGACNMNDESQQKIGAFQRALIVLINEATS
jgi:hypothetical protein